MDGCRLYADSWVKLYYNDLMRTSRHNLLILFVLFWVQCFAPLLHAHAHGQAAQLGLHWHATDTLSDLQFSGRVHASLVRDTDDSTLITPEPALRQHNRLSFSDVVHTAPEQPPSDCLPVTVPVSDPARFASAAPAATDKTRPFRSRYALAFLAQAPPVSV